MAGAWHPVDLPEGYPPLARGRAERARAAIASRTAPRTRSEVPASNPSRHSTRCDEGAGQVALVRTRRQRLGLLVRVDTEEILVSHGFRSGTDQADTR